MDSRLRGNDGFATVSWHRNDGRLGTNGEALGAMNRAPAKHLPL